MALVEEPLLGFLCCGRVVRGFVRGVGRADVLGEFVRAVFVFVVFVVFAFMAFAFPKSGGCSCAPHASLSSSKIEMVVGWSEEGE